MGESSAHVPASTRFFRKRRGVETNTCVSSVWQRQWSRQRLATAWAGIALCITAVAYIAVRSAAPAPSVHVRWSEDVDDRQREALETRFHLSHGEILDRRTWAYRIEDTTQANVAALVQHPGVEDTHKIDRQSHTIEGAPNPWDALWSALLIGMATATVVCIGVGNFSTLVRGATTVLSTTLQKLEGLRVTGLLLRVHLRVCRLETDDGRARRLEIATGLGLGLLFLAPLLIYGPWDNEEGGLGVFASQVFYRGLFNGHWDFWLNDLGFGTPMPIGQRLDFHPLFALGSLVSLRAALSLVWLAHVACMTVYFQRLARALGIGLLVRLVLTTCYVFSAPSVNYFQATDWVSVAIGWSVFPALVFYLRRVVLAEGATNTGAAVAQLALLGAFWVLNSHPGAIAPLALVLGVYALALAPPRLRVYASLLGAACLCAAASAERIYFLASEAALFPTSLPRINQPGFTLFDYAWSAAVPLTQLSDGLRHPFIGLVLGTAAVTSLFLRRPSPGVRAAGVAFVAATMLSLLPSTMTKVLPMVSGLWMFRDPMVLFGLLAGGAALQHGLDSPRRRWQIVILLLLAAQLLQQAAAVRPAFVQVVGRGGPLLFYRHQQAPFGLARLLATRAGTFGPRLYVSEAVRRQLRGNLSPLGVHFITDLVVFGLNPINGWFKNVSMDRLHPSQQLMHGFIFGQQDVIAHRPLLNVLGVNLVMTTGAEGPPPAGLRITDRLVGPASELILLGNPEAWPKAVLMNEAASRIQLPLRPGCPHTGALCRDYTALSEQRLQDEVTLLEEDGHYTARFRASQERRFIFISAMYRPEWQARASTGPLTVEPAAGAFLGAIIPPGVEEIDLRFYPRTRIWLTWFSHATLLILMGLVGGHLWRRRRRALTALPIAPGT